jgi:hypothetical protein
MAHTKRYPRDNPEKSYRFHQSEKAPWEAPKATADKHSLFSWVKMYQRQMYRAKENQRLREQGEEFEPNPANKRTWLG